MRIYEIIDRLTCSHDVFSLFFRWTEECFWGKAVDKPFKLWYDSDNSSDGREESNVMNLCAMRMTMMCACDSSPCCLCCVA